MIGMLLEMEYPKDIRVRKEAESLVAQGVGVVVITPWKVGQKREEIVNGVRIHRIGKNYTFRRKGLTDIFSALFFINWMYYFKLGKVIEKYSIQHLHVHDLPLANTALKFKKKINGKIILDSHENYPELLEGWFLTKKSFFVTLKNRLLFSPKRWKRYESRMVPKMDFVIAVIDEMRDKFIEVYQLDPAKIFVISNYEKLEFAESSRNQQRDEEFEFDPNYFHIVYVGGIGPMRGLDIVIHAVSELNQKGIAAKFVILGNGNAQYVQDLKELSQSLNVESTVVFLGYKEFSKVNYYMQKADVNIIPHVKNGHTDFTIPHKLFQIFLSKAPLLVSSCKPLKRIVEECDGGWVYEASSVSHLVTKIQEIQRTKEEEVGLKIQRAFQIAHEKYNWEAEAEKLASFYKGLN